MTAMLTKCVCRQVWIGGVVRHEQRLFFLNLSRDSVSTNRSRAFLLIIIQYYFLTSDQATVERGLGGIRIRLELGGCPALWGLRGWKLIANKSLCLWYLMPQTLLISNSESELRVSFSLWTLTWPSASGRMKSDADSADSNLMNMTVSASYENPSTPPAFCCARRSHRSSTRTVPYGPRSFAAAGPSTWNALPAPLRNVELSAMSFRRQLKTELYLYTLENIRISTLVTVFTVRVGERNFNVIIIIITLCGMIDRKFTHLHAVKTVSGSWCKVCWLWKCQCSD